MLRITLPRLTDTYRAYSTAVLRKLKSARSAVELSTVVKDLLKAERGGADDNKSSSLSPRRRREQEFAEARLVSAINTMLTECQTHHLWKQSVVVLASAVELGVPLKPNWPQMALSAAPDLKAKAAVIDRLRPIAGTFMSVSSSTSASATHTRDDDDEGDADFTSSSRPLLGSGAAAVTKTTTTPSNIMNTITTTTSNKMAMMNARLAHVPVNPLFDQFYLKQRVARDDTEMALLSDALRKRPALCFRVNSVFSSSSSNSSSSSLASCHPPAWAAIVADAASRLRGVECMQWCAPHGLVFHVDDTPATHSDDINNDANMSRSRDWIRRQSQLGTVSIQSPSSLLTASLVDAQPDEAVLDMCAAPGAKTKQLIDQQQFSALSPSSPFPSGVVVANEPSPHRHRLLSQSLLHPGCAPPTAALLQTSGANVPLFARLGHFDKVLVDAPCSGDGMMHKMKNSAEAWLRWSPSSALTLLKEKNTNISSPSSSQQQQQFHRRQVELLRRAVEVAKPGSGRIVYSTCTMNPLENEAVVATILRDGLCDLEPVAHHTSNLAARMSNRGGADQTFNAGFSDFALRPPRLSPGLPEWVIPVRDTRGVGGQPYAFIASSSPATTGRNTYLSAADATLFNGDSGIAAALAQCCGRLYPHKHHGFDAFFVAVLRRRANDSASVFPMRLPQQQQQHQQHHPKVEQSTKQIRQSHRRAAEAADACFGRFFSDKKNVLDRIESSLNCRFLLLPTSLQKKQFQLRALSSQAFAVASDDSHAVPSLQATGAAVANNVLSTTAGASRLTLFGAHLLGRIAERNVVELPLHVLRHWIGLASSSNNSGTPEEDLARDDKVRMRRGRLAALRKNDDDGEEDEETHQQPLWLEQLRSCDGDGQILVSVNVASSTPLFVPARRLPGGLLTCDLDAADRKMLNTLLASTAARPASVDLPEAGTSSSRETRRDGGAKLGRNWGRMEAESVVFEI